MSLRVLRPASWFVALAPLAPLLLPACASSAPPAEAPAPTVAVAADPSPQLQAAPDAAMARVGSDGLATPDDALMEMARWEMTFLNVMVVADEAKASTAGAAPSGAEAKRTAPGGAAKPPVAPAKPESMSAGGDDSPCHGACRAYASMKRAATRLCDLAGKEDDRCVAAGERMERASERLKAACPGCESIRD